MNASDRALVAAALVIACRGCGCPHVSDLPEAARWVVADEIANHEEPTAPWQGGEALVCPDFVRVSWTQDGIPWTVTLEVVGLWPQDDYGSLLAVPTATQDIERCDTGQPAGDDTGDTGAP